MHRVAIEIKDLSYDTAKAEIHSARVEAISGKGDELEKRLNNVAKASRMEEGCVAYEWYRVKDRNDKDDLGIVGKTLGADVFLSFEIYRDEAALQAHLSSPHFQAFFAREQEAPCIASATDASLARINSQTS